MNFGRDVTLVDLGGTAALGGAVEVRGRRGMEQFPQM